MVDRAAITAVVFQSLQAFNAVVEPDRRVPVELHAPIVGRGIGSLELAMLVVGVQDRLEAAFGIDVPLAEAEGVLESEGPLASVDSLISFVCGLLE